ncbi:hypothetical protein AB3S75_035396 [Citrus x aurantiifolia]
MDTEELIKRCRSIRLSEEEEGKVTFKRGMKTKGEKILNDCLVGKILLSREVKIERLRSAMQQVWKTSREIKIENLGDNVFMFKFGANEDKRRILAGGPWHFDRALIVLTEPTGIGDVKKQDFSHASFWVQLHDVPIMCMEKETATELGGAIGKLEEVETDSSGGCIGKFLRVRISIDITKPLKKLVVLENMENEREDAEGKKEEDIPMLVYYERLPDFYFCCGRIGHQYRECAYYKSQSKDELAYGPWLKATTSAERLKQSRGKERWEAEPGQPTTKVQAQVSTELMQVVIREKQQDPMEKEVTESLQQTRMDPGRDNVDPGKDKGQGVVGDHLMHRATESRGSEASYAAAERPVVNITSHGEEEKKAGKKTEVGKKRESKPQEALKEKMIFENKKELNKEPEMDWSNNKQKEIMGSQHKEAYMGQVELEAEKGVNEPYANKCKPIRRKWKYQARNLEGKRKNKEGQVVMKRPASSQNGHSPISKRLKQSSPINTAISQRVPNQLLVATQIQLEDEGGEAMEESSFTVDELSAVAGNQPRRQP